MDPAVFLDMPVIGQLVLWTAGRFRCTLFPLRSGRFALQVWSEENVIFTEILENAEQAPSVADDLRQTYVNSRIVRPH
jgi:hypothetical protein